MSRLFKRTKILATIGPAVSSPTQIADLIMAGVNGCRLNCSHGTNEERDQQIAWIRAAAAEKGRSVAIVQDLQGPKIRLGKLKNHRLQLRAGDQVTLDFTITSHDGSLHLPVQYNLATRVEVGQPLFIADGQIKTRIEKIVSGTAIRIEVENDGLIMSHQGLNLPNTDFSGEVITEKDLADIQYGAKRDVDYVALSFVQSAKDIEKLREILASHNSTAKIIAKIETKKAISSDTNLAEIVRASDGIMVARGDMAVEAGAEVVPIIQQKLINLCREHAKLCIIATQMMSSMVDHPEPTRAETSDVAHAVLQGADAVMLSEETANGQYPLDTVKTMKRIILYTQNHSTLNPLPKNTTSDHPSYNAISRATVILAEQIKADLIVCQTASGATATAIAAQRPNLPIVSVTDQPRVAGQLALLYGNSAFVRPYSANYGLDLARELKKSGYLRTTSANPDLTIVIVSGGKGKIAGTDTIKIRKI